MSDGKTLTWRKFPRDTITNPALRFITKKLPLECRHQVFTVLTALYCKAADNGVVDLSDMEVFADICMMSESDLEAVLLQFLERGVIERWDGEGDFKYKITEWLDPYPVRSAEAERQAAYRARQKEKKRELRGFGGVKKEDEGESKGKPAKNVPLKKKTLTKQEIRQESMQMPPDSFFKDIAAMSMEDILKICCPDMFEKDGAQEEAGAEINADMPEKAYFEEEAEEVQDAEDAECGAEGVPLQAVHNALCTAVTRVTGQNNALCRVTQEENREDKTEQKKERGEEREIEKRGEERERERNAEERERESKDKDTHTERSAENADGAKSAAGEVSAEDEESGETEDTQSGQCNGNDKRVRDGGEGEQRKTLSGGRSAGQEDRGGKEAESGGNKGGEKETETRKPPAASKIKSCFEVMWRNFSKNNPMGFAEEQAERLACTQLAVKMASLEDEKNSAEIIASQFLSCFLRLLKQGGYYEGMPYSPTMLLKSGNFAKVFYAVGRILHPEQAAGGGHWAAELEKLMQKQT